MKVFPILPKGLKVACHNVNRLINLRDAITLDRLKLVLEVNNPPVDLYCICETFLTEHTQDNYVKVKGFDLVTKDRTHKQGGGLIMYVRRGLDFKRRKDLETNSIEVIWLELLLSNKPILLCSIHRPPNDDSHLIHDWLTHMEDMLTWAYSENKPLVLTGDFNIDLLKEDNSNTLRTEWESLYENFELVQIIKEPTRVTDRSKSLIDHIYCSVDLPVLKHAVVQYGISDHFPIVSAFDVRNHRHICNGI